MELRDTSATFSGLVSAYQSKQGAVPVNFRQLVSWLPYNSPRYTHALHSYPAKVIPQIPHFFLGCRALLPARSLVLDPFGGSGTVALEACLGGHQAVASDSNPLARLLMQVKVTPISPEHLSRSISRLRTMVAQSRVSTPPPVINVEYWYHKSTIKQLARVAASLGKLPNSGFKRLAQAALSTTARKLSLADPRVGVPVRLKPERYPVTHPLFRKSVQVLRSITEADAIQTFFKLLDQYAALVQRLWPVRAQLGALQTIYSNSLGSGPSTLARQPDGSVGAVVTSPPYLGAQKYIRASSLSLGWLSMTQPDRLRLLEDQSIGREHFPASTYRAEPECCLPEASDLLKKVHFKNALRAHIAAQYLTEMKEVLAQSHRVLRQGGALVLVSGCNMLSGEVFDTTAFLRAICIRLGFHPRLEVTDIIKSRGLMTRRNRTAALIPLESVIVFQK